MERKRSKGVVLVAIIFPLMPFIFIILFNFASLISTGKVMPWTFKDLISTTWSGFVILGILGYGIYKLNNVCRIVTIGLTALVGIGGPLTCIIESFMVDKEMHAATVEKFSIWVDVSAWSIVLLLCLPYALIAFFLTRPKVKEQFK